MKLYIIICLLKIVFSQGPGRGVSKDTRACSEGVIDSTYEFMTKYFPVTEAQDDCRNRKCTCGAQARVQLSSSRIVRANNSIAVERRRQRVSGFGLHCVYAAGLNDAREAQSGLSTQEELEKIFSEKFGSMNGYDLFMEYSTGLYTNDISSFSDLLKENSEDYLTFTWSSEGAEYISVLVHPPNTQIIHEVVAPASTAPGYLLGKALKHNGTRFSFQFLGGEIGAPDVEAGTMEALFVSRATTNIVRDQKYFETVFGLSSSNFVTYTGTDPNGNGYSVLEVQMSSQATTKYRLIQPANVNDGDYSVTWWEDYQNDVNLKYMTSPTCGWPLMGDNHNAFDWRSGFDEGDIAAGMEELGMPYFCKLTPMGEVHCYVTTPYGYQIQLDGTYSNPPTFYTYSTNLCATYQEYC